jgi:hypothetical protein
MENNNTCVISQGGLNLKEYKFVTKVKEINIMHQKSRQTLIGNFSFFSLKFLMKCVRNILYTH